MSRIDDAWKRAGGHRSPVQTGEPPTAAFALEHYPAEDAASFALSADPAVPADPPARGGTTAAEPVRPAAAVDPPLFAQCRRLAGVLMEAQAARGLRTLMLTSGVGAEGTTTAAVGVARALSESSSRVLIIDADLRRPSMHQAFGVRNDGGVDAWLHGRRQGITFVDVAPHVSLLCGGRADPDTIPALTSSRFSALVEQCAGHFDWVVVDVPPVPLLPEPRQLARLLQAAVFVIGPRTPFGTAEEAMGRLGRASIVGTVLAGMPASAPAPSTQR